MAIYNILFGNWQLEIKFQLFKWSKLNIKNITNKVWEYNPILTNKAITHLHFTEKAIMGLVHEP